METQNEKTYWFEEMPWQEPQRGWKILLKRRAFLEDSYILLWFCFLTSVFCNRQNIQCYSTKETFAFIKTKGAFYCCLRVVSGHRLPITSLLSVTGWLILINEMNLDFSQWFSSASILNPSTYCCLESNCVWGEMCQQAIIFFWALLERSWQAVFP